MKLPRRQFLRLAAGAVALPAVSRSAKAEAYPTRPVHIVVGFPPGGGADIGARLTGQWLSERLGQPFVIENRVGASGNIGAEAVVRAPADGYTLLQVTMTNAWNATLYQNLSFNILHDIAPVASTIRGLGVMEVSPTFPAKTVPEFIAYAKANPGEINMVSGGVGTPQHLYGELFKMMTGVDLLHVPYRGTPAALTGLLAGDGQVMFDILSTSIEYIKTGKLRALALTSATRSDVLPDVPTIGEFVPGYEATSWQGIGARTNTPAEIVDRLNQEINAGLADPKLRARITDLGYMPFAGSPAEFGKLIAEDTEKWGRVIKSAGIKPD
jgi:tripartite-type tricarboxylate transporter receptor subunit TctC